MDNVDDGYILTLERLARPESNRAVYFQHGVVDTSYAWIAKGPTGSVAMRAFDQGYDVYLGNFRGAADQAHLDENISPKDYWNYTVNQHGICTAVVGWQQTEQLLIVVGGEQHSVTSKHSSRKSTSSSAKNQPTVWHRVAKSTLQSLPHHIAYVKSYTKQRRHKSIDIEYARNIRWEPWLR
jgi:hypothetical protein